MHFQNILLVDDHAVMRKGMCVLLNDLYPSLSIYEANNEESVLANFRSRKIDLLVMDVQMPETDTIGLVELVAIRHPSTFILIFSMLPEKIYAGRLYKAGAHQFLPKESTIDDIKQVFKNIFDSRKEGRQITKRSTSDNVKEAEKEDPFLSLSHREFEIMNRLLSGITINKIAEGLQLKPSTVGTYKSRIFEKLGVHTIFELKEMASIYSV